MAYSSLTVCLHTRFSSQSCGDGGGEAIAEALEEALKKRQSKLSVNRIYCFGICEEGPNVRLTPGGPFFHKVRLENLDDLLDEVDALEGKP